MSLHRTILFFVTLSLLILPAISFAFDHSHPQWDALLKRHVTWVPDGSTTQVDYAGFIQNHTELTAYLQSLSEITVASFDSWSRDQQLAFLINAYNAFTVELILSEYPDIKSIKDLGGLFSSPWKKKFFDLFGKKQNLDGIEHTLIRGSGRYNEPLVHFAVNCASIGCPALRNEAFVAERLEVQLLDQTRRFLSDRSRNRFNAASSTLEVSSIVDWYEEDFSKGWRGYSSLKAFIEIHAVWLSSDLEVQKLLKSEKYKIDYLSYDWGLNEK